VTGVSLGSPSSVTCSSQLCSHSYSCSSSSSVPCGAAGAHSANNGAAAPAHPNSSCIKLLQPHELVVRDIEMSEAEEQQHSGGDAPAAESVAPPAWADLPEGLLGRIACCLGATMAAVMPMYTTCRWGGASIRAVVMVCCESAVPFIRMC
jgi:hypothetical protein